MVQMMVQKAAEGDGRAVRVTETVEEARSALSEEDYDSVILDLFLPDGDGRQLLAEIRERPRSAQVQVLVLSGATGKNSKLECFRLGADEFLEKPVDPELLQAAVDRRLERARTWVTESRVDPLTGLPNRAALIEKFSELSAMGERGGSPLTLALIEMEGLEHLRDGHGREESDAIEAGFAEVLSEALEGPDVVGRWGDATFVVLLPGTDAPDSEATLSRVMAEIRSLGYAHSPESQPRPSASPDDDLLPHLPVRVGVVDGRRHSNLKSAVQDAEQALALAHGRHGGEGIAIHPADAEEGIAEKRRVLLVEDDPDLARLVEHRIRRDGMEVVHLASGSEVVQQLEDQDSPPYDIILCDVKLPGVEGFELLQRFKQHPGWSGIPVVMVTSMGREADVVRAFELGADDYVLKPVSPGELIARIHRLVRRS